MAQDIVDLRSFYASPAGEVARRLIGRILRARWENCTGLSVGGIGFAPPYLDVFRGEALRALALMPAEQGVVNWPSSGRSAATLVETTMLPLPDASLDRVLLVHALEATDHPGALLDECWRVLTPGGRLMAVAPNRRGLWARMDTTPFGHGQPWSRGQMRELMRNALFSPVFAGEALYMPPMASGLWLRFAVAVERIGSRLALPGAGVHIVEATKQLYRPVGARRVRRSLSAFQPVLTPAVGRSAAP